MYLLYQIKDLGFDEYQWQPLSVHFTLDHAKNQMRFEKSYNNRSLEDMEIVEVSCPDV